MSEQLTPLQRAVLAIKGLRAQLDAKESAENEPLAIVGMACRFPGGADTPEAFWDLLKNGVDTITPIPDTRWNSADYYDPDPDAVGKMSVREGGYLHEIGRFDPQFFGISPREAQSLDPQQQLLLTVAWEALERAGLPPARAQKTGVFIGIGQNDYTQRTVYTGQPEKIEVYDGTGNGFCFASGRLSYALGLQGPNLAVDTACSSSLVSLHLACQSLRAGECDAALAGGVQLSLSPEISIFLSQTGALSPDGRCKTFDASADGFSRGEGCGLLVLKRLSTARADRDHILAVVRGSATNHDGASGGLTVPNLWAQADLLREALKNARLDSAEIDYIEAHGTGTILGDPIEIEALAEVYGDRSDRLPIGSVKTNVGHLEAAAGIVGVMKVILAMQHGELPPHIHFDTPNPRIAWAQLPFDVVTERTPWHRSDRPRRAGVSSFGISGTNAHVILESYQPDPVTAPSSSSLNKWHVLPLSAHSPAALQEMQTDFAAALRDTSDTLENICFSASLGRTHHEYRVAVSAESLTTLPTALTKATLRRTQNDPRIAFLFTGQGSQSLTMGATLYKTEPLFRAALDKCNALFKTIADHDLPIACYAPFEKASSSSEDAIHATVNTQPALFAIGYALAALWKARGITPSVVIGHSVGELAAACILGVFSLNDGMKLAIARGRLMQILPPIGSMLAVQLSSTEVQPYLSEQVSLAAINAPQGVVLSGNSDAITAIETELKQQNIKCKALKTSHAFHSDLMRPMVATFTKVAATVTYHKPQGRFISTVTGESVGEFSADYWRTHILSPVNFLAAIEHTETLNIAAFVEIGAAPILCGLGQQCLPDSPALWLPSLRPSVDDAQQIAQTTGALYTIGAEIQWADLYQDQHYRRVVLPTYPFQTKSYLVPAPTKQTVNAVSVRSETVRHLQSGNTEKLLAQLIESGAFSAEQKALLPDLITTLAQQVALESADIDDKFYAIQWQPDNTTPAPASSAEWFIIADDSHLARTFSDHLHTKQISHTLSNPDLLPDPELLRGKRVLWFKGCDATTAATSETAACELLAVAQVVAGVESAELTVITHHAITVKNEPINSAQTTLWGMGRTLSLELKTGWGRLIDWDGQESASLLTALHHPSETQIAVRAQTHFVPRIVPTQPHIAPVSITPDAAYLITGGTGSLGLQMAQWLVQQGARYLYLTSRRGITTTDQTRALEKMQAQGAIIEVVSADVTHALQMESLFQKIAQAPHPLRGILHTAGIVGQVALEELTPEQLITTLRPKVTGSELLHQLSDAYTLDFFVLFSSIAAAWGSKGQAHYAAANAYQDGLAHQLRQQNVPALALSWGAWGGGGMATDDYAAQAERAGINLLQPATGMAAFAHALGSTAPHLIIADIDWSRFYALYALSAQKDMFAEIAATLEDEIVVDGSADPPFSTFLTNSTENDYDTLVLYLQREVADILGFDDVESAEKERGFTAMGFDSLMSIELKNRLQTGFGVSLSATIAFDYPTILDLAPHIAYDVLGWTETTEETIDAPTSVENVDVGGAIVDRLAELEQLLGGLS